MIPACVAVLAGCLGQPGYVLPAQALQRPPPVIRIQPRPPELPPYDPVFAPPAKQYSEPAPNLVWAKKGGKTYHCPGSKRYDWGYGLFLTEPDAIRNGFRPAGGQACFRENAAAWEQMRGYLESRRGRM